MSGNVLQRAQERKSEIKKEQVSLKNKIIALDDELEHLNYFFKSLAPYATQGNEPAPKITVVTGTVQILKREKKYLNARQVTDSLIEMGYETSAKSPIESIRAILSGEAKRETNPRIIRKDTYYGLPGWLDDPSIKVKGYSLGKTGITVDEGAKYQGAIQRAEVSRIPQERGYLKLRFWFHPPLPWPHAGPPQEIMFMMNESSAGEFVQRLKTTLD
ncbi:MAG: HTH domain-containing protein [Acidobacteriota bacterium]|nr:HTH domain-containing protein [Acidobacteriota bacterium]